MSKFVGRNVEVLVTSCGGAGTTLLLNFIAQYKITNHYWDKDKLKHLSVPPVGFHPSLKVVYVIGEPIPTLISVFRRGFANGLSRSLQKHNKWSYEIVPKEQTLDEFASNGVDQFLFKKNYENWHDNFILYPTLFVKYEKIWNYLPEISSFLDLPLGAISTFPVKVCRESDLFNLDPRTKMFLEKMYMPWQRQLKNIPDFEIIKNKKGTVVFLTYNFWLACLDFICECFLQCSDRIKSLLRGKFPIVYEKLKARWYFFKGK